MVLVLSYASLIEDIRVVAVIVVNAVVVADIVATAADNSKCSRYRYYSNLPVGGCSGKARRKE